MPRQVPRAVAWFVVAAAAVVFAAVGAMRYAALRRLPEPVEGPQIHVPLWVDPAAVRQSPRLAFTWDGPGPLGSFRAQENLDAVVAGAVSDEDLARRLASWTRRQFELGRPDPYPPPDAATTLAEIRAGRTGGFCAQYCFVLVQALQSLGAPARLVTIRDHEVTEVWLRDQRRWVMVDPTFELEVADATGRTLSAWEIREAVRGGVPVAPTSTARLTEAADTYVARFSKIAVWLRNAFTSQPVNFADFNRYRAWLDDPDPSSLPRESIHVPFSEDLYGPPTTFPAAGLD